MQISKRGLFFLTAATFSADIFSNIFCLLFPEKFITLFLLFIIEIFVVKWHEFWTLTFHTTLISRRGIQEIPVMIYELTHDYQKTWQKIQWKIAKKKLISIQWLKERGN